MATRKGLNFGRFVFLPIVMIIALVAIFWSSLLPVSERGRPNDVVVQKGWSAWKIADELESRGLIKSRFSFWFYAQATGRAGKLQAGRYRFRPAQGVAEISQMMVLGLTSRGRLTLAEGFTIRDLAQNLEARGICEAEDFISTAEMISTWRALLPAGYSVPLTEVPGGYLLEGLLFPDTYYIAGQTTPDAIIGAMLKQFNKKVASNPGLQNPPGDLTRYETLVLASLVESEARLPKDRPLIAGVILNRLKKKMPLQIDATVLYAKGKHQARVSIEDTYTPSLFNTYQVTGLPPKPICNPGLASIRAAYNPTFSDYIYYVATSDGSHIFSRTFEEHKAARIRTRAEMGGD